MFRMIFLYHSKSIRTNVLGINFETYLVGKGQYYPLIGLNIKYAHTARTSLTKVCIVFIQLKPLVSRVFTVKIE